MSKKKDSACPCGSGLDYADCCRRFIEAGQKAATPEQLMRSRYCAYRLGYESYLLVTWHRSTKPASLNLDDATGTKWIGLEILSAPPPTGDEGFVEFIARFRQNGRAGRMHERSRFWREAGEWFYVTGEVDSDP